MARFSVDAVFRGIDRVSAPVSRMQNNVRRFSEQAERRIRNISRATEGLSKAMISVGTRATFGAAGLVTGISLVNSATARVENLSEGMGVSANTIRAVGFATRSLGLDLDSVTDLVEEMNNKFGESLGIEELGPVTESLSIIGLEFNNIKKLSPEDQFNTISDALLKMEDETKRAAAADILFGGEANKLFSVMALQGGSMDEIKKKFEEVNFLTDEGTNGAKKWGASMGFTTTLVETLGQQVAGLAGDALAPMLDLLNETAVANKSVINKAVTDFFAELADTIKWAIENFSTVVAWIKRVATGLAVFFAFTAVLKTLVLVLTAVNLVMAANPVVLVVLGVIALIAALAALVVAVVSNWDTIVAKISSAWETIKMGAVVAIDFISEKFSAWKDFVFGIADGIKNTFVGIWEKIKSTFTLGIADLKAKIPKFSLSSLNPFADDDETPPAPPPQLISPEVRAAQIREEKTTTSKVDIAVSAAPGSTAEMTTSGPMTGVGMALANSRDFA